MTNKFFCLIAAFIVFFLLVAPNQVLAAPFSTTVYNSEDTNSHQYYPNNNYGGAAEIWASTQNWPAYQYLYMKPNLSSLSGKVIVGGTSYWYAYGTGSSVASIGSIYPVTSNWSEYSLTWNNSPTVNFGVSIGSVALAVNSWTNTWLSADIGNIARYWNINAYGFMMSGSCWARINSRESGNAPYHIIYYYNQPGAASYSNVGQTSATISWGANGNPGDAVYSLYRNGSLVYKGSSTSYNDTGLSPAITYNYTVYTSYDADGTTYLSSGSTVSITTAPGTPVAPTGTVTALNWSNTAGRGRVVLNWSTVTGATGYKVWIFDGNTYRAFDVGNTTTWDSSTARIYPDESWLTSQADNSIAGDPFYHNQGGFDLRDDPVKMYIKTVSTTYDTSHNYWFRISAYNGYGESPYGNAYMPTLPNRTDTVGPSGSITLTSLDGLSKASSQTVNATITTADTLSGVRGIQLSNDNVTWDIERAPVTQITWNLSPGAGSKTVYMKIWDNAGNSTVVTGTIALADDFLPPSISLTINEGAESTNAILVTLDISINDNVTLPAQTMMSFSNDGNLWSNWEAYNSTKSWNITTGYGGTTSAGIKKVFVRVYDQAQNTGRGSAQIGYNPNPPTAAITVANSTPGTFKGKSVIFVKDDLLDIDLSSLAGSTKMRYDSGFGSWSDWEPFNTNQSITLAKTNGVCKIRVQIKDSFNVVAQPITMSALVDGEAPAITSLRTVSGAVATSGTSIWTTVDVSDNLSRTLQYSTDGSTYFVLPGNKEINFPINNPGSNTLTVYIKDEAGNVANKTITIRKL